MSRVRTLRPSPYHESGQPAPSRRDSRTEHRHLLNGDSPGRRTEGKPREHGRHQPRSAPESRPAARCNPTTTWQASIDPPRRGTSVASAGTRLGRRGATGRPGWRTIERLRMRDSGQFPRKVGSKTAEPGRSVRRAAGAAATAPDWHTHCSPWDRGSQPSSPMPTGIPVAGPDAPQGECRRVRRSTPEPNPRALAQTIGTRAGTPADRGLGLRPVRSGPIRSAVEWRAKKLRMGALAAWHGETATSAAIPPGARSS